MNQVWNTVPSGTNAWARNRLTRRAVRPTATALGVVLVLIGVVATYQLGNAREEMLKGGRQITLTMPLSSSAASVLDASSRFRLRRSLEGAERHFAAARNDVRFWAPVLKRMKWLPGVGPQLAAAPVAADASFYSTRGVVELIDGLASTPRDVSHPGQGALVNLTRVSQAGHGSFVAAALDSVSASRALAQLPPNTGNALLDRARVELRRVLPYVRRTSTWLALAPELLGANHPSRYLIAFEDQTELRATGGLIAAADLLTVRGGHISSRFSSSALPHEITNALVPLPEAAYTPETRWTFRDSNWSPDFPLSARLERWFYGQDTGQWADTVVNVTNSGVVAMLRATGPIYLPDYGLWVNADNVLRLTQRYVNDPYQSTQHLTSRQDTERKRFLGAVMAELLNRVEAMPIQSWTHLATALSAAVEHGDLLAYDRNPDVEAAIKDAGAGDGIRHTSGDYLYVVDDNRSYNKINPYVQEWGTYRAALGRDHWIDAGLTLHYHVNPSPAGLEGVGPGYGQWGTKHDYQDFIRIYVPAGSVLRSMSGVDRWAPASAYGLTQLAGRLLVREGQTATVTVQYRVPANALASQLYRLTVQHQPASNLSALDVTVRGLPGITLSAPASPATDRFRTVLNLHRDAALSLSLHGNLQPHAIDLPATPTRPDPYLPLASVTDPRHPL